MLRFLSNETKDTKWGLSLRGIAVWYLLAGTLALQRSELEFGAWSANVLVSLPPTL